MFYQSFKKIWFSGFWKKTQKKQHFLGQNHLSGIIRFVKSKTVIFKREQVYNMLWQSYKEIWCKVFEKNEQKPFLKNNSSETIKRLLNKNLENDVFDFCKKSLNCPAWVIFAIKMAFINFFFRKI